MKDNGLNRFVEAQNNGWSGYETALREIRNGRKVSHWIWYIFPQFREFGHSDTALYYGIRDVEEAQGYLKHPVLGARLREISDALLEHAGEDIVAILGDLDAKKTRSCMTLFDYLSPNDVFGKVLVLWRSTRRKDSENDPKISGIRGMTGQ